MGLIAPSRIFSYCVVCGYVCARASYKEQFAVRITRLAQSRCPSGIWGMPSQEVTRESRTLYDTWVAHHARKDHKMHPHQETIMRSVLTQSATTPQRMKKILPRLRSVGSFASTTSVQQSRENPNPTSHWTPSSTSDSHHSTQPLASRGTTRSNPILRRVPQQPCTSKSMY